MDNIKIQIDKLHSVTLITATMEGSELVGSMNKNKTDFVRQTLATLTTVDFKKVFGAIMDVC